MKILQVGAELFHEEGQTGGETDRHAECHSLTVAFRNLASAPEKAGGLNTLK